MCSYFLFFKQKTAYEMRISDWSSDVCSSDLEYDEFPKLMLSLRILAIEQYERLSCIAANSFSSSRSRVINSKRFSGRKGSMNREAIFDAGVLPRVSRTVQKLMSRREVNTTLVRGRSWPRIVFLK